MCRAGPLKIACETLSFFPLKTLKPISRIFFPLASLRYVSVVWNLEDFAGDFPGGISGHFLLPALLQKPVGDFLVWEGNLAGNLRDFFSRAAKRGCFKRGGFPIWTCPSFFVLFRTFPIFLGFSRFARGWFGDFPDLSFSSFSAY